MSKSKDIPLYYGATAEIFHRAKVLRENMTEAEKLLWEKLSYNQILGLKFRRQHPINQFIVDFYCHKLKLVIELDGGVHNKNEVKERDKGREVVLENFDITIIRFTNEQVFTKIESVVFEIERIAQNIMTSKPL